MGSLVHSVQCYRQGSCSHTYRKMAAHCVISIEVNLPLKDSWLVVQLRIVDHCLCRGSPRYVVQVEGHHGFVEQLLAHPSQDGKESCTHLFGDRVFIITNLFMGEVSNAYATTVPLVTNRCNSCSAWSSRTVPHEKSNP